MEISNVWVDDLVHEAHIREYEVMMDWLWENHHAIACRYREWLIIDSSNYRIQTPPMLKQWLTSNHPELIPMIDLLLASQDKG